jgi:hypothetical protein
MAGPDCPSLQEWFTPMAKLRPCTLRHGEALAAAAVTAQVGGFQERGGLEPQVVSLRLGVLFCTAIRVSYPCTIITSLACWKQYPLSTICWQLGN